MIDDRLELVTMVALFVGVLAIGVSLGASLGLAQLQTSCVQSGQLPAPGVSILPGQLDENACLDGAKRLQSIGNGAAGVGLVLLLGGGVLDHYDDRVREVLA